LNDEFKKQVKKRVDSKPDAQALESLKFYIEDTKAELNNQLNLKQNQIGSISSRIDNNTREIHRLQFDMKQQDARMRQIPPNTEELIMKSLEKISEMKEDHLSIT